MSLNEEGDVVLTSGFDKFLPSLNFLEDDRNHREPFFSEDTLLASTGEEVQAKDQLSLLMQDLDFDLDFLNEKSENKELRNELEICDDRGFESETNLCPFSHSSPVSSDSGNHSPSSTSSEGIQFGELWQDSTVQYENVQDTGSLKAKHFYTGEKGVISQGPTFLPADIGVKPEETPNHLYAAPVQLSDDQTSSQQPVLYLLPPSTSNSFVTQQKLCIRPAWAVAIHPSVDKAFISKKPAISAGSSNRMQPYSINRPQLIIPKPDPETFSAVPIATKSLINTVPLATPATLVTSVAKSKVGPTIDQSSSKIFVPVSSNGTLNGGYVDIKFSKDAQEYARKREERKIKNRASAQQSRLRKRHELDELKQKLDQSEKSIRNLQSEIDQLRKQVACLQNENTLLRKSLIGVRGRTGVVTSIACLMFFCIFTAFSQNPITRLESFAKDSEVVSRSVVNSNLTDVFHGRSLLSVDYSTKREGKQIVRQKRFSSSEVTHRPDDNEDLTSLLARNDSNDIDCGEVRKAFLNQTERIRMNNDLSNWVDRHERLLYLHMRRVFRAPVPKLSHAANDSMTLTNTSNAKTKKLQRIHTFRRNSSTKKEEAKLKATRERAWRHLDLISSTGKTAENSHTSRLGKVQFGLFGNSHRQLSLKTTEHERFRSANAETRYLELARAIKQKEDTLYVVAMQDYYLLPATNRNSTDRPRISLILPAFSYNGTFPNQVAMMRIDCEVTGTGLLHISDSLLLFFYNQRYYHQ